MIEIPDPQTDQEFWSNVDIREPDECWHWKGKPKRIYGYFIRSGHQRAHRYAFWSAYGPIPPRMCVCHSCDNPSCCNPDHLFLGTVADNTNDMHRKGRGVRGEKQGQSKLTESQVRAIRRLHGQGFSTRVLEKQFPVARSVIAEILRGEIWRHVD